MSASPLSLHSPPQTTTSPAASGHIHEEVTLEDLVAHLLAAKRSLSSINNVWRANEIVTSARAALEESAVLNARIGFLRNGIKEEVNILRKVRRGIERVYTEGQDEFKNVIRTLDAANSRLETTMDNLRSTMVEAAFRPAGEPPRSLLDFVDEHDVETMRDSLKESIRESKEIQTEFDTSILAFDNHLRDVKSSMGVTQSPSASQSGTLASSIPAHLHALETNAQEMASLLESLVSHFDLCVNAVRNTEGGYAAVRRAASAQPAGEERVSVSGVMKAEDDSQEHQATSEEERREMLDVLVKDAEQVEDVMMEMGEFLAEMEQKFEFILHHVAGLNDAHSSILATFRKLEDISSSLPRFIIASQDFRMKWEEIKFNIQEQLVELEGMRIFYENYYNSYDGLLLEVWRRKQTEDKIKSIMSKAMDQVERVLEADKEERATFHADFGEYLPNDLWSGVNAMPASWEFARKPMIGDEGEVYEVESVPGLKRSVVEAADKREKERLTMEP